MKLQKAFKVFVASLLYIIGAIVLFMAPFATAYGSFDYFKQYSVDGVSVPEFWMIFLFGFLFAVVLIASISFAVAVFKIAGNASDDLD